jgi:bacillithiol biosynthesis cysteine-adding enzyme BshC
MDPSSIKKILDVLPEKSGLFEKAYLDHDTLADATRYYVNELFGKYGLVVIDADEKELKTQIKNIIKDDLLDHHANDLVESTSSKLSDKGYKTQVYPRAINLFYTSENFRNRIIKEGGIYKVIDLDVQFSEDDILKEIENKPQNFSPNVILRPLYQEIILPNIAYIGGPAEIAYWLQLKDMFDHFKIPMPVILPRNFVVYISKGLNKKMQKLRIRVEDIFKPFIELKDTYLEDHTDHTIDLNSEEKIMDELFDSIQNKTRAVDKSLEGFVEAEKVKALKSLGNIEKRLKKSEEQKQSVEIRQLESLKEKLFPGGNLQERTDNYLNFALNNPDFIENIKNYLDPFDFKFNIIIED